jgi:hypothetical protein
MSNRIGSFLPELHRAGAFVFPSSGTGGGHLCWVEMLKSMAAVDVILLP